MSGLANYSVDTTDPLNPVVVVNGEVVEQVQRVTLDVHVGQVPRLFLERDVEAGIIRGTGVVIQNAGTPPEAIEVLSDFFANIDPAEFERAMLDKFEMGSGIETTGQAALAVLQEWVKRG